MYLLTYRLYTDYMENSQGEIPADHQAKVCEESYLSLRQRLINITGGT